MFKMIKYIGWLVYGLLQLSTWDKSLSLDFKTSRRHKELAWDRSRKKTKLAVV